MTTNLTTLRKNALKETYLLARQAEKFLILSEGKKSPQTIKEAKRLLTEYRIQKTKYLTLILFEAALYNVDAMMAVANFLNGIALPNRKNEIGQYLSTFDPAIRKNVNLLKDITRSQLKGSEKRTTVGAAPARISILKGLGGAPAGESETIEQARKELNQQFEKLAKFVVGYITLFGNEERANELKTPEEKGMFARFVKTEPKQVKIVKKAFSLSPDFNAEAFVQQVKKDESIIETNLNLESNYREAMEEFLQSDPDFEKFYKKAVSSALTLSPIERLKGFFSLDPSGKMRPALGVR